MDTTLLWIQGLALMLFANALYNSVNQRTGRFQPLGNAVLYVLILLTFLYLLAVAWAAPIFLPNSAGRLFFGSLAALFAVGAVGIHWLGKRPAAPGLPARALEWNWKWLLAGFVISVALESLSLYNFKISTELRAAAELDKARAFAQLYDPPLPDSLNAAGPESTAFDRLVRSTKEASADFAPLRNPAALDPAALMRPPALAAVESNRRPLALAHVAAARAGYFSLEESLAFPWTLQPGRAEKVALLEHDSRERDRLELGQSGSRAHLAELLGARVVQRSLSGDRSAAAQDLNALWGLERFHNLGPLPAHTFELALQAPGWTARDLQTLELPEPPRLVDQLARTLARAEAEGSLFGFLGAEVEPDSSLRGMLTPSSDPLDRIFGVAITLRSEYELQHSRELLDRLWAIAYLSPAQRTAALHTQHTSASYDTRWLRDAMVSVLTREALRREAKTALAFLRHRAETGRDVSALGELVPAELDAVPADPFDGAPLRLASSPSGVVIYSVGPDGRDDHGKMLLDFRAADALGDVVFRLPHAIDK